MNRDPDKLDFTIDTAQQKSGIRKDLLARLESLALNDRARRSAAILTALQASALWKNARTALIYHPLRSEPDTGALFDFAGGDNPMILLPRVTRSGLDIHRYAGVESLRRSPYGILESDPTSSPSFPIDQIELALIPGVAFDPDTGIRLGRGGGYYDRLLADRRFTATVIGIAFDLQIRTRLPAEAHDRAVDYLLTESGLRPIRAVSDGTPESV